MKSLEKVLPASLKKDAQTAAAHTLHGISDFIPTPSPRKKNITGTCASAVTHESGNRQRHNFFLLIIKSASVWEMTQFFLFCVLFVS